MIELLIGILIVASVISFIIIWYCLDFCLKERLAWHEKKVEAYKERVEGSVW